MKITSDEQDRLAVSAVAMIADQSGPGGPTAASPPLPAVAAQSPAGRAAPPGRLERRQGNPAGNWLSETLLWCSVALHCQATALAVNSDKRRE